MPYRSPTGRKHHDGSPEYVWTDTPPDLAPTGPDGRPESWRQMAERRHAEITTTDKARHRADADRVIGAAVPEDGAIVSSEAMIADRLRQTGYAPGIVGPLRPQEMLPYADLQRAAAYDRAAYAERQLALTRGEAPHELVEVVEDDDGNEYEYELEAADAGEPEDSDEDQDAEDEAEEDSGYPQRPQPRYRPLAPSFDGSPVPELVDDRGTGKLQEWVRSQLEG